MAADGLEFPNGLAFIEGGRTLVVAETRANRLTAFAVKQPGMLADRQVYADLTTLAGADAAPDGLWGTSEGVWVATLYAHVPV